MQISMNPSTSLLLFPLSPTALFFSLFVSALCTCLCFRFCGETETGRRFLLYKIRLLVRSVELITRIATTLLSPLQRMLLRKYKVTIPVNLPAFYSTSLHTIFSVFPHTLHSRGVVCVTTRHVSEFISYVNTVRQCLMLWLPVRFMYEYVLYIVYVPGSGLIIYYPTANKRKRKYGSSFGFRYS